MPTVRLVDTIIGQLDLSNNDYVVLVDVSTDENVVMTVADFKKAIGLEPPPGGEVNTASNVGTGQGVFKQKDLVDLEFHSLKSANNVLTIGLVSDDVELTINQANIDHTLIANKGSNSHATIDTHLASASNPHSVTKAQVGLTNVTNDAQVKKVGSLVDNEIVRANGATGDLVQGSGVLIGDSKNISGFAGVAETVVTASVSGTYAIDWRAGTMFILTLTAATTFSFSNVPAAGGIHVELVQGGAGSFAPTLPGTVLWGDAGAPTWQTTAAKRDVVSFWTVDSGSNVRAAHVGAW